MSFISVDRGHAPVLDVSSGTLGKASQHTRSSSSGASITNNNNNNNHRKSGDSCPVLYCTHPMCPVHGPLLYGTNPRSRLYSAPNRAWLGGNRSPCGHPDCPSRRRGTSSGQLSATSRDRVSSISSRYSDGSHRERMSSVNSRLSVPGETAGRCLAKMPSSAIPSTAPPSPYSACRCKRHLQMGIRKSHSGVPLHAGYNESLPTSPSRVTLSCNHPECHRSHSGQYDTFLSVSNRSELDQCHKSHNGHGDKFSSVQSDRLYIGHNDRLPVAYRDRLSSSCCDRLSSGHGDIMSVVHGKADTHEGHRRQSGQRDRLHSVAHKADTQQLHRNQSGCRERLVSVPNKGSLPSAQNGHRGRTSSLGSKSSYEHKHNHHHSSHDSHMTTHHKRKPTIILKRGHQGTLLL